jgi:pSer/pThr/pTyr-binding forkhead associated (FHA) protein
MDWFERLVQRLRRRPSGRDEVRAPAEPPGRSFLIVDSHRRVALTSPRLRVGRARDNDIVIDNLRVSRYHLELRWQADLARFLAVDLNSSGGTLLNGHPIRQCTLEAGDVLLLGGSAELIYDEAGRRESASDG